MSTSVTPFQARVVEIASVEHEARDVDDGALDRVLELGLTAPPDRLDHRLGDAEVDRDRRVGVPLELGAIGARHGEDRELAGARGEDAVVAQGGADEL